MEEEKSWESDRCEEIQTDALNVAKKNSGASWVS